MKYLTKITENLRTRRLLILLICKQEKPRTYLHYRNEHILRFYDYKFDSMHQIYLVTIN